MRSLQQTQIFKAGEHGYHTYRIPALVASAEGTLLAFCEARKNSRSDHGDIDMALRRSFDNGETWTEMAIVWDEGENTVGNPCPVLDRDTGTIWLPFCLDNERVFVTSSDDDGATWSTPREITQDVHLPQWPWHATGPTHGIQLDCGRLVIPCDHKADDKNHSHIVCSDDHGETWRLAGLLTGHTDECGVVRTADGSLYLNMRSYQGKNRRAYAWSEDRGETWSEVRLDDTLVEPVCQGSIVRFTIQSEHGKNRVLFANPASTQRERLTVRMSEDECRTWDTAKVLHEGPAAYCDLCIAPDMSICCLYERGEDDPYEGITFARFTLDWLTDGRETLSSGG